MCGGGGGAGGGGGGGREGGEGGAAKHNPVSGILVEEGHTLGAYFCENGSRILLEEGHTSGGQAYFWSIFLQDGHYFWSTFLEEGHTSGHISAGRTYFRRTGILLEHISGGQVYFWRQGSRRDQKIKKSSWTFKLSQNRS